MLIINYTVCNSVQYKLCVSMRHILHCRNIFILIVCLVSQGQTYLSAATTETQKNEASIHCTIGVHAAGKHGIDTNNTSYPRRKEAEDALQRRHW